MYSIWPFSMCKNIWEKNLNKDFKNKNWWISREKKISDTKTASCKRPPRKKEKCLCSNMSIVRVLLWNASWRFGSQHERQSLRRARASSLAAKSLHVVSPYKPCDQSGDACSGKLHLPQREVQSSGHTHVLGCLITLIYPSIHVGLQVLVL